MDTGNVSSSYSSAMLVINVPVQTGGSFSERTISCSIDARWAPGLFKSQSFVEADDVLVPIIDPSHIRTMDLELDSSFTKDSTANFAPKNDGSWHTLALGLDWLNTLTPRLVDSNSNQTTLTSLLEIINLRNTIDRAGTPYQHPDSVINRFVEMIISTVIVDGLSRIGGQDQLDAQNFTITVPQDQAVDFLEGTPNHPRFSYPQPPSNATSGRMAMTHNPEITGLAYSANDTARQLALALLLTYVLIVVVHLLYSAVWGRREGRTCDAWKDIEELIVLAQNSPPQPNSLANTCGGVDKLSTWARRARVRAVRKGKAVPLEEQVHLLVDYLEEDEAEYEKLHSRDSYGQS